MRKVAVILLLILSCAMTQASAQTYNVKDYGAVGDGNTNDYEAFKTVVDLINKSRGGTMVIPNGVYFLDKYNDEKNNYNLTFKELTNLKVLGNNSLIRIKGNITRLAKGKNQALSNTNSIVPFNVLNSSNVDIRDLEIDGGVRYGAKGPKVAEGPGHLIKINECQNVKLENLYTHHAFCDGLLITGNNMPSSSVIINNVRSNNNARQGITIGYANNVMVTNSTFQNNGYTNGNYGHHSPAAGLDIEPNLVKQKVYAITFKNCIFKDNLGSQIVINNPVNTNNVHFVSCNISNTISDYKYQVIVSANDVYFDSCMFDLKYGDIYPTWHANNTSTTISNSTIKSTSSGIISVTSNAKAQLSIQNSKIIYTGTDKVKQYFPFIRMTNAHLDNIDILIPQAKLKANGYDVLIQNAEVVNNIKVYSDNVNVAPKATFSNAKKVKLRK